MAITSRRKRRQTDDDNNELIKVFDDISKSFSHLSQLLKSGRYGNFGKAAREAPGKRQKKDPAAPRRNLTSYIIFAKQARPQLYKEHPTISPQTMSTLLGSKWREMSADEKKVYEDEAKLSLERYREELKIYENREFQGTTNNKSSDTKTRTKKPKVTTSSTNTTTTNTTSIEVTSDTSDDSSDESDDDDDPVPTTSSSTATTNKSNDDDDDEDDSDTSSEDSDEDSDEEEDETEDNDKRDSMVPIKKEGTANNGVTTDIKKIAKGDSSSSDSSDASSDNSSNDSSSSDDSSDEMPVVKLQAESQVKPQRKRRAIPQVRPELDDSDEEEEQDNTKSIHMKQEPNTDDHRRGSLTARNTTGAAFLSAFGATFGAPPPPAATVSDSESSESSEDSDSE